MPFLSPPTTVGIDDQLQPLSPDHPRSKLGYLLYPLVIVHLVLILAWLWRLSRTSTANPRGGLALSSEDGFTGAMTGSNSYGFGSTVSYGNSKRLPNPNWNVPLHSIQHAHHHQYHHPHHVRTPTHPSISLSSLFDDRDLSVAAPGKHQ